VGLFDRGGEPVFLKEPWDPAADIVKLDEFKSLLTSEGHRAVDDEIRRIRAGARGEREVAYALRSSHMPIRVIPDLRIEHEGLTAQIDFLVLAPKRFYLIECKNLYGDITVTRDGEFRREYQDRTEGMFSPIEQNRQHLELIRAKRRASRGAFMAWLTDRAFNVFWKSFVVLANVKNVLNVDPAFRDQVIRLDQLVPAIRRAEAGAKEPASSIQELDQFAARYLEWDRTDHPGYLEQFAQYRVDRSKKAKRGRHAVTASAAGVSSVSDQASAGMFEKLRGWRRSTYQAEGIPAYAVFRDAELYAIIDAAPRALDELRALIGPMKAAKYGADVLRILWG